MNSKKDQQAILLALIFLTVLWLIYRWYKNRKK